MHACVRVCACVYVCVCGCGCVCVCVSLCGGMGERNGHKKVIDLNENILDLRLGLEPTTSIILERRLNLWATWDLKIQTSDF